MIPNHIIERSDTCLQSSPWAPRPSSRFLRGGVATSAFAQFTTSPSATYYGTAGDQNAVIDPNVTTSGLYDKGQVDAANAAYAAVEPKNPMKPSVHKDQIAYETANRVWTTRTDHDGNSETPKKSPMQIAADKRDTAIGDARCGKTSCNHGGTSAGGVPVAGDTRTCMVNGQLRNWNCPG